MPPVFVEADLGGPLLGVSWNRFSFNIKFKFTVFGPVHSSLAARADFCMFFISLLRAVPSKIPTGLFGPLPPQTFSLLLGQSSLTSKGITLHPGIIDSNCKGEIQIMMSSQILWQFKRGDKIAQLLLLLYVCSGIFRYQ